MEKRFSAMDAKNGFIWSVLALTMSDILYLGFVLLANNSYIFMILITYKSTPRTANYSFVHVYEWEYFKLPTLLLHK